MVIVWILLGTLIGFNLGFSLYRKNNKDSIKSYRIQINGLKEITKNQEEIVREYKEIREQDRLKIISQTETINYLKKRERSLANRLKRRENEDI